MHIFDPKFFRNWKRYIFQCLFVVLTMAFVLMLLDSVYQTVLIAALGASSVLAFSAPSMRASRPRCMVGGYVVGIIVGCGISLFVHTADTALFLDEQSTRILLGALAVGLTMFVMVTTDTEHPPGAALALGFVLNEWDFMTIAVVMAGITAISAVKEVARSRLIDLL
ncbi:MAG: HPP family protein [Gammaproteobacteria bacterium]